MTEYNTPTTELEAVNEMLRVIGESPVNTIDSALPLAPDVDTAVRKLRSVSREVQSRGWHFNSERDFPLVRNGDSEIPVPANALRVDTTGLSAGLDVVHRGSRLYDRAAHSYQFKQNVTVGMVILLPFEELPEAARNYITVRASRAFQAGSLGSQILAGLTEADERNALALMQAAEGDTADYNVFTGTSDMRSIIFREGL